MVSRREGINNASVRSPGFTLIELMIAIMIIGILVAIVVPVYLSSKKKAQETVAEYNYRVACTAADNVWLKLLEQNDYSYRDSFPPGGLGAGAYVDAQYMSLIEPRMRWSDLIVTGNHMRIGNQGVYQNGEIIVEVPGTERFNWEHVYGTTGIISDAVWLDGRWQNNHNAVQNDFYLTVVTVSQSGIVRYTTYRQGVPIQYGTFTWDDGNGHP